VALTGGEEKSMAKRVLVVDDEPMICDILARTMRERGWTAVSAGSLEDAKRATGPWDLVIADIRLPNGDGRELRELLEGTPFLAISGEMPLPHVADEHFLGKPFTRAKLISKLAEFVPGIE
jgi:DNA-binding response OmpR family regulator